MVALVLMDVGFQFCLVRHADSSGILRLTRTCKGLCLSVIISPGGYGIGACLVHCWVLVVSGTCKF